MEYYTTTTTYTVSALLPTFLCYLVENILLTTTLVLRVNFVYIDQFICHCVFIYYNFH